MTVIDLLVKEHRTIEQMIPCMVAQIERIEKGKELYPAFIVSVVDFFRTYADRCHHGKEEDILFRALASKPLSEPHKQTMNQLTEEHVLARKLVGGLLISEERYSNGDKQALKSLKAGLSELIQLYPKHMVTEEKDFFLPALEYLGSSEKSEMLKAFGEFDAKLVHEKYRLFIEDLKRKCG
jgi:hemerythrin-like domain-containing protein